MDYEKIIKNIDMISGQQGLENLLKCSWCVEKTREMVLKQIVSKYGFIILKRKEDTDALPGLLNLKKENVEFEPSTKRILLAKKFGISPAKVKKIGKDKYLIKGKVYDMSE